MNKKTIKDIDFKNKTTLVRVDFNVPFKDGVILDDNRIVQALDTIFYLIENEAKVVLCSHLGKIKKEEDKIKNDLKIVVKRLSELLKTEVKFSNEVVGEEASALIKSLKPKEVLLLQNTRYEEGETKNDETLVNKLIEGIDVFVNDAFGTSHRKHASVYGVSEALKNKGKETAIGFLVEKEVNALNKCIEVENRPFVAILGGAKVSDKIKVIDGLLDKADKLIIAGAMAYTFLLAKGKEVGKSLVEIDKLDYAKQCLEKGKDKIILPLDHVIADKLNDYNKINITLDQDILEDYLGVDIGPKTVELFTKQLKDAKTIFWNGPMGVCENELFANGTLSLTKAIIEQKEAFSVVGGGDSAAFVINHGFSGDFSHVSTGGGASLEMIENEGHLPGIDIIEDKKEKKL